MFEHNIRQDPQMFRQMELIGKFIGQTPIVDLSCWSRNPRVRIFAKRESEQFGGSVKSRAAFQIIRKGLRQGGLQKGKIFLDASSGNTAIAYSYICKALHIPLRIVIPENASGERVEILERLGASLHFSSPFGGTDEAQEVARELSVNNSATYYYADQYNNDANWQAHYKTTAEEILRQTKGCITHFVSALGTTGTFVGTSRRLKEEGKGIECVALQPDSALHALEGWKHLETAKVPGIFDYSLVDRWLTVSTESGFQWLRTLALQQGLLLSPSSSANVAGSVQLSEQMESGCIVTILPDDANKYGEFIQKILS